MFLSLGCRGKKSDRLFNANARRFLNAGRLIRPSFTAAILAAAIVLQAIPAADVLAQAGERPNIVLVLADDLGYGDIGCYGNQTVKTPNLDRFALSGVRLTNCYSASANCSPSRAGLMTGRTPVRVGIHNWIPMYSPMHVRRQEVTVATLLRNAGYATCQVGKWHLNGMFNDPAQPQPSDHGFDHWFSTQNNALPNHVNPDNFVRNGKPVGLLHGYSAGIVADEAIRWLRGGRKTGRPFFLFVCFHEPHEPIATAPRFSKLYDYPDQPSRAAHHGNISQMDDAFGRLLQALDDMKLSENTFVAFTSDNGPAITGRHPHGSAGPLRDKKGAVYEGGIRVPGMVRWPGKTTAGAVSAVPVSGVDFLPTLCKLAGTPKPADRKLDGANFLPALQGQPIKRKTPLYWQFNRARGKPKVAMRKGDWKILAALDAPPLKPSGGITEEDRRVLKTAELTGFELYRLATDIAEAKDMTRAEPERLKQMSAELVALYHDVRQESPLWPVWEWPRYETSRIIWGP